MNRKGPIIIIEDDQDDQDILKEVLEDLSYSNKIIFFNDGEDALKHLTETRDIPFIIFSDINMPKLNGMELREKIFENEEIRVKSIPFLFFSTTAEQKNIVEAYSKSVQGFFVKPNTYKEIKEVMKIILDYWTKCEAPKNDK